MILHSRNFSLVTTVNHFVDDCPNLNFLPSFLLHRSSLEVRVQLFHLSLIISTLEIALANILRDVLVLWMWRMSMNATMWTFLVFSFLCAFFVTSFHSFSIVAFASGINISWNERSFVCASRFPEACVSEREISRIF